MKILFDQGTPAPLRQVLKQHKVLTAYEMGWSRLDNGKLLAAAEAEFDLLVTTDQTLQHQQRLTGRYLAILILPTTSWPVLRAHQDQIVTAINELHAGDVVKTKI